MKSSTEICASGGNSSEAKVIEARAKTCTALEDSIRLLCGTDRKWLRSDYVQHKITRASVVGSDIVIVFRIPF